MSTLEHAIALAAKAHEGQIDKAGEPYILHPIRMMLNLSDIKERIVAILHDVIEDTECTLDNLRKEGFSEEIIEAVSALTHQEEVDYMDFIQRAASNPIARRVKLADLRDNHKPSKLP